jgi:hypothetical protein
MRIQIGKGLAGDPQRIFPRPGAENLEPAPRQQAGERFQVHLVVLDDEQGRRFWLHGLS